MGPLQWSKVVASGLAVLTCVFINPLGTSSFCFNTESVEVKQRYDLNLQLD